MRFLQPLKVHLGRNAQIVTSRKREELILLKQELSVLKHSIEDLEYELGNMIPKSYLTKFQLNELSRAERFLERFKGYLP